MPDTKKFKILGILGLFWAFWWPFEAQAGLETIFGAYSVRTAKEEGCPVDYEFSVGVETEKFLDAYCLLERVNNLYYFGSDLDLRTKYIEFSHHRRDAQQINSQSLKVGMPFFDWKERYGELGKKLDKWIGTIKLGGAVNWQNWSDARALAFISLTARYYRLSWESNFGDRTIYMVKAEVPISLPRGFFLSPYSEIQQVNEKRNFWSKVKFGWRAK